MCIFLLRHGMTAEDQPGHEKITGWKDVPLDADGRANAARAGRYLKSKGITSITASDTQRAAQTAEIVGDILGLPTVESDKLRSWNMGALQGMDATAAKPFLEYFEKSPEVKVPKGEAFQTFYNRFKGAWSTMVSYSRRFPNAAPLIVTHSQGLDLINWFLKGIEPGRTLEFGDGVKPGGLLRMDVEGDKITLHKVRV